MIAVCFLIAAMLMLAMRFVPPEGGLPWNAPRAAGPRSQDSRQLPAIKVRLEANAEGQLSRILLNQRQVKDIDELRAELASIARDFGGPDGQIREVELDCDYGLKYAFTLQAITAISAYAPVQGRPPQTLVEHVKFSPRRSPETATPPEGTPLESHEKHR